MKYLRLLFALMLFVVSMPATASKADNLAFDTPITLTINDQLIKMDVKPFLHEGTTFVPIRFVSEGLGAERVTWHPTQNSAEILHEGKTIVLPKGKQYAYVNGEKVKLGTSIKLLGDRLFVPVRFVSEQLDCQVDWIFSTYTVSIEKEGITVPKELVGSRSYTDDEIYWLSKIIHAESRGEPMEGKVAVGNIVLNRVESRDYPNTVYGVIFDRKGGVQFSPTADGSIYLTPQGDSIIAAKRALEGEEIVDKCLFFLNPRTAESSWIIRNRPYYTTIANHDFYL